MAPLSPALLRDVAETFARLSVDPADLAAVLPQLAAQADGLVRLDSMDLGGVEPATVLLPPAEGAR